VLARIPVEVSPVAAPAREPSFDILGSFNRPRIAEWGVRDDDRHA
jgi:hypothetical protein